MSSGELVTILIWNTLTVVKQKTLKDIQRCLILYHSKDFPKVPKCHKTAPILLGILRYLLVDTASLRFMDSTMIPVCKRVRANDHKVARNIAAFGKNHQGWHYGFKLHASVDSNGRFCGLALTPANIHDAQMRPKILNENARVVVGDTSYGTRVMGSIIWELYGTIIVAPPHPKQDKKVLAWLARTFT